MQGEGIIYSPKWYDKSGKPLENSNAVQPNNLSEVPLDCDSELGGDEPDNEVMSAPPVPNDVVGDGSDKDDAKSREASGAGSDSGSGSSGSGSSSGSEAPARTRLAADRAGRWPTAMPKAMLQGTRSGRRRNRINPSMRSQTKNPLQR